MDTIKFPTPKDAPIRKSPAPSVAIPAERRRIFGTDGVRGVANIEPVTAETALKLGRAAAHVVTQLAGGARSGHKAKIVLGKDTRLSGYMLENALAAGIMSPWEAVSSMFFLMRNQRTLARTSEAIFAAQFFSISVFIIFLQE